MTLKLSAQDDVVELRTSLPTFYGTIHQVQAAKRLLIFKSQVGEKTFTVPPQAKITVSKEPGKLEDLRVGQVIAVMMSQDQKNILEIRTVVKGGKTSGIKLVKFTGILIDVDPEKHHVQIFSSSTMGDSGVLFEYDLTRDANYSLVYNSKPFRDLTLEEVARGTKANYYVDVSLKKVQHIQVEMPILGKRMIQALDPAKKEIVIDDGGKPRAIAISPKTKIWAKSIHGTWNDLKEKSWVTIGLTPSRKFAELVVVHFQ